MIHLGILTLALALSPQEITPERIFDTPRNHWIFEAAGAAHRELFLFGWEDPAGDRPPPGLDRFSAAMSFYGVAFGVIMKQREIRTLSLQSPEDPRAIRYRADLVRQLSGQDILVLARALHRCSTEFAFEVRAVKASPMTFEFASRALADMYSGKGIPQIGSALRQFPDVPKDHWAAKAVLELRKTGILEGYPDGRFGTTGDRSFP